MAPPHVCNNNLQRSLTAPGKGTVPAQSNTATFGSSSVPDRNASKSNVTEPTSTYYGDEGNIGAKLAMDDRRHQPKPVGVDSLMGPLRLRMTRQWQIEPRPVRLPSGRQYSMA
jgi:hypothetical protein